MTDKWSYFETHYCSLTLNAVFLECDPRLVLHEINLRLYNLPTLSYLAKIFANQAVCYSQSKSSVTSIILEYLIFPNHQWIINRIIIRIMI